MSKQTTSTAKLPAPKAKTTQETVKRIREVIAMTGLSRSSIYAAIKRGTFPAQLKLSTRSSGWLESEVIQWRDERPRGPQPDC